MIDRSAPAVPDRTSGTVAAMAAAIRGGATSSFALVEAALDRIDRCDDYVHAFTHVDRDGALAAAREADRELTNGIDRGSMHGIPYGLKDIYDAAGMVTTCGSRLRPDMRASEDSSVAARLRAAGAVLLGKLSTFEFALGGPSFDGPFPPTRNPWNVDHVPGGSSSGSGAAIAAGYMPVAMGTCTTGSIRGPAAWCGAVGLKPTFGRVSRHGVFPLAPTLDHCGPLTRSVRDAAIALQITAGHDPRDPHSADVSVQDYTGNLEGGVRDLRIGVPRSLFAKAAGFSPDARAGTERVLAGLREAGCEVIDVPVPELSQFVACARVLMAAESFAIHRRDLARRLRDYGEIAARRFAVGATVSAADLIDTLALKRDLTRAVDRALDDVHVLVTAVSLSTAPRLEKSTRPVAWPLQCSLFNVTGHPAIAVPIGLGRDGLPLSVQVVGGYFEEDVVLRTARWVEHASGWAQVPLPTFCPELDRGSARRNIRGYHE